MTEIIAQYSVQIWRSHFHNCAWVQTLEDSACDALDGRFYTVSDYMTDTHLLTVRSNIRPLTPLEAKENGRTFAEDAFLAIDFQVISADMAGALNEAQETDKDNRQMDPEDLVPWMICLSLERFSNIILFISNICFFNCLTLSSPFLSMGDDRFPAEENWCFGIDRSGESFDYLDNGVAPIISFDEALSWSKTCSGIWNGMAETSLEKAVSFLSHAFSSDENGSDIARLIWCTAGLEAISCDSSESIAKQLKKRLPLLTDLVKFKNISKSISSAYDFRSRISHGNIATMNAFNTDEVNWYPDRYDSRMNYFGIMLQSMLIAAIWKSMRKQARSIIFREVIDYV